MYQDKRIIAIIPARGGSKRVPGKNLVEVGGVSLVERAVRVAKDLDVIDMVVVSSDYDDILHAGAVAGAEALKRPDALAADNTRTAEVVLNVLDTLLERGESFDYLVLLEPTSPLRHVETVFTAIKRSIDNQLDSVGTVVENRSYFWRQSDGVFVPLFPNAPHRTQEREPLFWQSGVCYVTSTSFLRETGLFIGGRKDFIVVSAEEAVDIDNPIDVVIARALHDGA